jgi:membrane associated rhomboid family serine protease
MLFLAVFGKNVEDAYGHVQYLLLYFAGGFVATLTQTAVTLWFGSTEAARVPNLGASGAIAAVLGAFFILYPKSTVFGLIVFWPAWLPAWVFLGFWFLYQLFEGGFGIVSASANGGGTAFFAHVGGFVFGAFVTVALMKRGVTEPRGTNDAPGPAVCGL